MNLHCLTYLPENWKLYVITKMQVRAPNAETSMRKRPSKRGGWKSGPGPPRTWTACWGKPWAVFHWLQMLLSGSKAASTSAPHPQLGTQFDWAMRKIKVLVLKRPVNYPRDSLLVNLPLINQKWFCRETHGEMIHLMWLLPFFIQRKQCQKSLAVGRKLNRMPCEHTDVLSLQQMPGSSTGAW